MVETIFSWKTLWVIMWVLYLPSCIGLIIIVLLQKGKGSGFAGAFGVGTGSETVFGPRARKSLPVKLTYAMAAIFMVLSLSMSLVAGRVHRGAAPEAVTVDKTDANAVYDQLLGGTTGAQTPVSTPAGTTPAPAGDAGSTAPPAETPAEGAGAAPVPAEASSSPAQAPAPEATTPAPAGDQKPAAN